MNLQEWNELDAAACVNLNTDQLRRFHEYKEELRRDNHQWECDAHDILAGFIWDEIEDFYDLDDNICSLDETGDEQ